MKHLKFALATLLAFALLPPFSALAQTHDESSNTQASTSRAHEATWLMMGKNASSSASSIVPSNEESAKASARRTLPHAKSADGLKLAIGVFAFSTGATLETVGIALAWHQYAGEGRTEGRCESPLANAAERKPTSCIASKR